MTFRKVRRLVSRFGLRAARRELVAPDLGRAARAVGGAAPRLRAALRGLGVIVGREVGSAQNVEFNHREGRRVEG